MKFEHDWENDPVLEQKKRLIEENEQYWANKEHITCGDKWIYVYHGMSSNHFEWAVHENIAAKGLQKKTHFPIISVIDGHGRALPEGLDESFGIEEVVHLFYSKYLDESAQKRIHETAEQFAESTYQKKEKLLQLEYRGIKFGDELYDTLLLKNWQNDEPTFDCFDFSMEQYTHYIRGVLSLIDHTFELFSKKTPAYVITTEKMQLKRLFGDIARIFGAEEIIILNSPPDTLVSVPAETKDKKVMLSSCLHCVVEQRIQRKKLDQNDTAPIFLFHGEEKAVGKQEFLARLGIKNSNPNVFVLPHALIDIPRENSLLYFYHDYLEWFSKTLEILKETPAVNWIIKDHPMTAYYRQNNVIEKIFLEHRSSNMYWCDSGVGGACIKDIADCVVTCGGEAALEYWAYGIPTITTAATFFSGYGISHNIKTQEEYEYMLRHISEAAKPSEESSKKAAQILLAMKEMSSCETEDQLVNLFMRTRKAQVNSYYDGLSFQHVSAFCEGYRALLKEKGTLEKSCIYQLENVSSISL